MAIRVGNDIEKKRSLIRWLVEQFENGKPITFYYHRNLDPEKGGIVGELRVPELNHYEVDVHGTTTDGPVLILKGDTFGILKYPDGKEILIRKLSISLDSDGIIMSTDVGYTYFRSFPGGYEVPDVYLTEEVKESL